MGQAKQRGSFEERKAAAQAAQEQAQAEHQVKLALVRQARQARQEEQRRKSPPGGGMRSVLLSAAVAIALSKGGSHG